MTKGTCTATTYKTIRTTYTYEAELDTDADAYYPSDHLAVVSYITLD
jgi:hypothetical protein